MAGTLLAILQNRLELAGVELHESTLRFIEALILGMAAFFLASMAVVFVSLTLVAMFWDHLIFILLALALAYFAGSAILVFLLKKKIRAWPSPFATTIQELKKDRECLSPRK
jgi:uncharacterized membrane protein YqjE